MPTPPEITLKRQIADSLRELARLSDEPGKTRYLTAAAAYEEGMDLVGGSRRAIDDSKALLAGLNKRFW